MGKIQIEIVEKPLNFHQRLPFSTLFLIELVNQLIKMLILEYFPANLYTLKKY